MSDVHLLLRDRSRIVTYDFMLASSICIWSPEEASRQMTINALRLCLVADTSDGAAAFVHGEVVVVGSCFVMVN